MSAAGPVAMPYGVLKTAVGRNPSVAPGTPAVPTNVVTTPSGVILRMVWLNVSAMTKVPDASIAMPLGVLNLAAAPTPSAAPWLRSPASAVTTPCGVIRRTRFSSSTYSVPEPSTATARGNKKRASLPVPSRRPLPPILPTNAASACGTHVTARFVTAASATVPVPAATVQVCEGAIGCSTTDTE